jgi:hypothetical protein
MNERIKQLEELCWEEFGEYEGYYHVFNAKKFAQLIVRECLEELRYTVLDTQELRRDKSTDYQVGWEDGMFDAGETIKNIFGVEE